MSSGLHLHLAAEYQQLAPVEAIPAHVHKMLTQPLQHQIDTFTALQNHDIVINEFPTGTGKTKAALLWLLERPRASTLLIAPVNELVQQHARDAKRFVTEAGLPHVVIAVDAAYLRQLPSALGRRPGARFHRALTNPILLPELQDYDEEQVPPLLLVINPDLFYYSIFYLFNTLDRRNIAQLFMTKFQYIIIDEVHYYNTKQFANLLFFILISKEFGYFEGPSRERRKLCLLTATPDADITRFLDRLASLGIAIKRLEPEPIEEYPLTTKSLTELELTIYPYTHDAASELSAHVDDISTQIEQGQDGAIILNSLYGVNRSARIFEQRLGTSHVGRITGPLSRDERSAARFKPLLLATPTVDIGFNFEGHPKERQNLDFVVFEAALEDQFWQRIGRAGRVLGKPVQSIQSTAIAFIPDAVYTRLRGLIEMQALLARHALKSHLHEAAGDTMQRISMTDYVRSYSLLEITHPLVEMGKVLGQEHTSILDQAFTTIQNIYAPSSKRTFARFRGEINRFQDFRRLLNSFTSFTPYNRSSLVKALREYMQQEHDQTLSVEDITEHIDQFSQNSAAKKLLRDYVLREIKTLKPLFNFRESNVSVNVKADDPKGLVSARRGTVELDLLHLLRFFTWSLKEEKNQKNNHILHVVLTTICEPPLKVVWHLKFSGNNVRFRKSYVGKPTALKGLTFESKYSGTTIPLPPKVAEVISQQYIPGLILEENSLKPWMWGSLIRDSIYPCDLVVTFDQSGSSSLREKTFRLYIGMDGYRIMARFGWSIERQTADWWIV